MRENHEILISNKLAISTRKLRTELKMNMIGFYIAFRELGRNLSRLKFVTMALEITTKKPVTPGRGI